MKFKILEERERGDYLEKKFWLSAVGNILATSRATSGKFHAPASLLGVVVG